MTADEPLCRIIIGVETHKYMHVAVAIDTLGVRIADQAFPADSGGYQQLAEWAEQLGRNRRVRHRRDRQLRSWADIALRRRGRHIVEVPRGNRQARRANGKSDTADAEIAARQVLAGVARASRSSPTVGSR